MYVISALKSRLCRQLVLLFSGAAPGMRREFLSRHGCAAAEVGAGGLGQDGAGTGAGAGTGGRKESSRWGGEVKRQGWETGFVYPLITGACGLQMGSL